MLCNHTSMAAVTFPYFLSSGGKGVSEDKGFKNNFSNSLEG